MDTYKHKRSGRKKWLFALFLCAEILITGASIPEYTAVFTETFDNTEFMGSESTVVGWGSGQVLLGKKPRFLTQESAKDYKIGIANLPEFPDTIAAADFTGDGKTDYLATSSHFANALVIIENSETPDDFAQYDLYSHWVDGTVNDGSDMPLTGVQGAPLDRSGYCALTCGDYDADGDMDFMLIGSESSSPYPLERIWLYKNLLMENGSLGFQQYDKTSDWGPYIKGIAWSSSPVFSVDYDGDGDFDILIGNRFGEVWLCENINSGTLDEETFLLGPEPLFTSNYTYGRGITALCATDYNSDSDMDIIVGSVSGPFLECYRNDGADNFELAIVLGKDDHVLYDNEYDGGATALLCYDFDADGDEDLIVGVDGANFSPGGEIGGVAYYFENKIGNFESVRIVDIRELVGLGKMGPSGSETEAGMERPDFDYIGLFDSDGDGYFEFCGMGNHFYDLPIVEGDTEIYGFGISPSSKYSLFGSAVSEVIAPDLMGKKLITKVAVKDIYQGFIGASNDGLKINYYVSNNGGDYWHFVDDFISGEIVNRPGELKVINFKTFGSHLLWRADLFAENLDVEGWQSSDDEYWIGGASNESPYIDAISLEYYYVDEMEFSRASAVATTVTPAEGKKNIVIAPSFVFPSWEGHLRAYEVTDISFPGEPTYDVKTVSVYNSDDPTGRDIHAENTTILWDAGDVLKGRLASNRDIYTSIPEGNRIGPLNRIEFTTQNYAYLKNYLQGGADLIDWIRGEGKDFKLGWIDHSTPIVVNPPSGDYSTMGNNYDTFKETWAARQKMIIVGSNGGMIHCFKAEDGDELWGYIPFNLLYPLEKLGIYDKQAMTYLLNENGETYVDSTPVVADVYIDMDGDGNDEWATVLVCGQGTAEGKGLKDQKCYHYFALDITNPEDPQPLWEIGPEKLGYSQAVPEIGRVIWQDAEKWVAFLSSGEDKGDPMLYCVDIETGEILWSFQGEGKGMPAGPATYDIDNDGTLDRVYIGDFKGHMWKVDLTAAVWEAAAIYEDENEYPIRTKAAVWTDPVIGETTPHLYFGMGGSDNAPNDKVFAFVSLVDAGEPYVEWYMGEATVGQASVDSGSLDIGEKFWSDPLIADSVVYFTSFFGNIEDVDPVGGADDTPGRLYARFINASAGSLGGTALGEGGSDYLNLASKTRAAITIGGVRESGGSEDRDVWINEYNSTLQVLSRGGGTLKDYPDGTGTLKIRSWREVRRIIRNLLSPFRP